MNNYFLVPAHKKRARIVKEIPIEKFFPKLKKKYPTSPSPIDIKRMIIHSTGKDFFSFFVVVSIIFVFLSVYTFTNKSQGS